MQDSIFTKIIQGDIPSEVIYEDKQSIAFLSIMPVQPGHTLVVPKKQIDHLWDLPDDDYIALMKATKFVAKRMKDVLKTKRIGVKVVGEEVPHAHIHLIPFDNINQYNKEPALASPHALSEMAKKLRFAERSKK